MIQSERSHQIKNSVILINNRNMKFGRYNHYHQMWSFLLWMS